MGAVLGAFAVFRVLDVWKPGPIGALERLPAGWGVMMDDVLAGAVAGALAGGALLLAR
jgi:phosphatidylglycerophosphatase A